MSNSVPFRNCDLEFLRGHALVVLSVASCIVNLLQKKLLWKNYKKSLITLLNGDGINRRMKKAMSKVAESL